MKNTLLITALIAVAAAAQTASRLDPADHNPIAEPSDTDPTHGAIIPADATTFEDRVEDANDTEAFPSLFRHEFSLPGNADDDDLIRCGGDVRDPGIPDFAPYQGVRCTTSYPISQNLNQAKPADCPLAWYATFVLPAKGKAEIRWECRGDTDFSSAGTALEDGQSIKGDGWQCTRQGSGISCENAYRHGFTIDRMQKYY